MIKIIFKSIRKIADILGHTLIPAFCLAIILMIVAYFFAFFDIFEDIQVQLMNGYGGSYWGSNGLVGDLFAYIFFCWLLIILFATPND